MFVFGVGLFALLAAALRLYEGCVKPLSVCVFVLCVCVVCWGVFVVFLVVGVGRSGFLWVFVWVGVCCLVLFGMFFCGWVSVVGVGRSGVLFLV